MVLARLMACDRAAVASHSARSLLMQRSMAKAGAITAFIEWLFDPKLGQPELAAQLAHIADGSSDAQTTIAERAITPLVNMLHIGGRNTIETQLPAAAPRRLEGHAPNQIEI